MKTEPGTKVLITQDCREGGVATGKVGVYEGDFPLTVLLFDIDGEVREIDYQFWVNSGYSEQYPHADSVSDKLDAYQQEHSEPRLCPIRGKSIEDDMARMSDVLNQRKEWRKGFGIAYWFESWPNPRIRLEDGSVIWGAECWWGTAEDAPPLAEAQAQTEAVKGLIRTVLSN